MLILAFSESALAESNTLNGVILQPVVWPKYPVSWTCLFSDLKHFYSKFLHSLMSFISQVWIGQPYIDCQLENLDLILEVRML